MMLFSPYSLLPFISFILYSCRPTAVATLGYLPLSLERSGFIECWEPLPDDRPPFPSVLDMCAGRVQHRHNLECECIGPILAWGSSSHPGLRALVEWCFRHCGCGPNSDVTRDDSTMDLDEKIDTHTSHSGNNPTGSTHTCSGTCTSVGHGCNSASTGDCKCFAPPVSLFYWHKGDCGTRLPFKAKRDLAQQRHSYDLNATAQFASSNKATAPPGPVRDLAAHLVSGLLPSPCNASYVSFACSDSPGGIVHEPPQNWLGALAPEGAKELPPVPKEFLRIHGGKEGKMQVLRPAVD